DQQTPRGRGGQRMRRLPRDRARQHDHDHPGGEYLTQHLRPQRLGGGRGIRSNAHVFSRQFVAVLSDAGMGRRRIARAMRRSHATSPSRSSMVHAGSGTVSSTGSEPAVHRVRAVVIDAASCSASVWSLFTPSRYGASISSASRMSTTRALNFSWMVRPVAGTGRTWVITGDSVVHRVARLRYCRWRFARSSESATAGAPTGMQIPTAIKVTQVAGSADARKAEPGEDEPTRNTAVDATTLCTAQATPKPAPICMVRIPTWSHRRSVRPAYRPMSWTNRTMLHPT